MGRRKEPIFGYVPKNDEKKNPGRKELAKENENLQICSTLFLLTYPYMVPFSEIFDFNLRRDHKKISYERRNYESVDGKRVFLAYVPKNDEKIIQDEKG